jgi:hypothetical protein
MPHHPKPWFRPARNAWYVQLNGLQRNLGAHPQSAPVPRKRNGEWNAPAEVLDAYHKLMAAPAAPVIKSGSVIEVIDKFLDWCQENRKQKTYEWYRWRLQAFCNYLKNANIANLPVAQLRHFHIDEHLIRRPAWSSGMKHGACRGPPKQIFCAAPDSTWVTWFFRQRDRPETRAFAHFDFQPCSPKRFQNDASSVLRHVEPRRNRTP